MNSNKTYKSIDYSKKISSKSWGILSFNLVKKKDFYKINSYSKIYFSRTIIYIENDNTISQIGKMYVPFFSFKYFWFFINLILSRKTLGHYVNDKFGMETENVTFEVLKEYTSKIKYSVLLNKLDYQVTERVIEVKTPQLAIYVEEYK